MSPPTPDAGRIVFFCVVCGARHEAEGNRAWLVLQRSLITKDHQMRCTAPLGEERPT